MALRNEDREWISEEISSAIDSLKPRGWRKAVKLLRELGPIATVIGVVVALGAITLGALYQSWGHVKEETEFRTHTNDALKELQDGVKDIRNQLTGMSLKKISENPVTPKTITEARNILAEAVSSKIQIDQHVIRDAGVKFVEAAQKDPAAWDTATAFLNYKSFLDASSDQFPANLAAKPLTTHYKGITPLGDKVPTGSVPNGTAVPIEQAARFSPIGEDQNRGLLEGNPYFILDGGGVVIDGMDMKNVIFRGVHIVYHGGPLKMSNVYFANCVFDVVREPTGESFATTFLKSGAATTFTAG
ncbi:MAG: hypothetical protein WBQ76_17135 [Candidatus Korobacteraceae bacterium]